jgi:hypothetical protein
MGNDTTILDALAERAEATTALTFVDEAEAADMIRLALTQGYEIEVTLKKRKPGQSAKPIRVIMDQTA